MHFWCSFLYEKLKAGQIKQCICILYLCVTFFGRIFISILVFLFLVIIDLIILLYIWAVFYIADDWMIP